jgi:hypothetical protein
MTGEILDSDIEYAQRLISEGRSDEAIAEALRLRGNARDAAANLLTALRSGQRMRPNMILLPKHTGQRMQSQ